MAASCWLLAPGRWPLPTARWLLPPACWLLAAGCWPLAAQTIDDVHVEDDNAQMDFWLPAQRRPDTELTNAALLRVVTDGAPLWGRWIHLPACRLATATQACATTDFQLGQDMYTPAGAFQSSDPRPGARPYAGWLYLVATARAATASVSDALSVETGVTGTPSLAEKIQTAWHGLIGYPRALGWSHQIPFQPGILVAFDRDQEVFHAAVQSVPVISIVPQAGVAVGNVLTGAHVGAEGRVGYGVTTPWSAAIHGRGRRIEVYGVARAREDLVAYELVLDGSGTRPATHVDKEPLVLQYEFGAGARFGPVEVEYRGVTRDREYKTGPPQHAYGVVAAGIRPGW